MICAALRVLAGVALLAGRALAADAGIPEAFADVPGRAEGVVVAEPDLQHHLGRFGEAGHESAFSTAGQSYRWIYLLGAGPAETEVRFNGPGAGNVYLPEAVKRPSVESDLAAAGIVKPYTVVQATVNDGLGSAAEDRLVLSNIQVLDGSPGYPPDTSAVVEAARGRYAKLAPADFEAAMEKARTGPATPPPAWGDRLAVPGTAAQRGDRELVYVTWMPQSKSLVVCFRRIAIDVRSTLLPPASPATPASPAVAEGPPSDTGSTFRHTQWAAERDVTFTWKAGKLEHSASAPRLYQFEHRDEGASPAPH